MKTTKKSFVKSNVILPDVTVNLINADGNVFAILGTVSKMIKRAGHGDRCTEFMDEATAGDYDHALRTCMKWVNIN